MEISEFPNISFEHPRGSAFRKHRSQTLAPVQFTNPNSNHRAYLLTLFATFVSKLFKGAIRYKDLCGDSMFDEPGQDLQKVHIFFKSICINVQ